MCLCVLCCEATKPVSTNQANVSSLQVNTYVCHYLRYMKYEKCSKVEFLFNVLMTLICFFNFNVQQYRKQNVLVCISVYLFCDFFIVFFK